MQQRFSAPKNVRTEDFYHQLLPRSPNELYIETMHCRILTKTLEKKQKSDETLLPVTSLNSPDRTFVR